MKKIMKKLACAALTAALVITSLAVAPDTQAAPKTKKMCIRDRISTWRWTDKKIKYVVVEL